MKIFYSSLTRVVARVKWQEKLGILKNKDLESKYI
jgi:hypothetical protein